MVIEHNRIHGGTRGTSALDTIGPAIGQTWSGSYTFRRNWIHANPGEEMLDLKAPRTSGSVYTFEDNYWDCTLVRRGCLLFHGTTVPTNTYTVNFTGNYVYSPSAVVGRGSNVIYLPPGQSPAGITYHFTHNIFHYLDTAHNALEINRDNVSLINNTFINGRIEIGHDAHVDPRNLVIRQNIMDGTFWEFERANSMDECSYNLMFENRGAVPTCTHQLTSDPLFIDRDGDWRLRAASPARHAGLGGQDLGAYAP